MDPYSIPETSSQPKYQVLCTCPFRVSFVMNVSQVGQVQEGPLERLYWWCSTYSFTAGNGNLAMLFWHIDGRIEEPQVTWREEPLVAPRIQAVLTSPSHTSRNAPRKVSDFTFMLLPGGTCFSSRCNALVGGNKVLWNRYQYLFTMCNACFDGLSMASLLFLLTQPLYTVVISPCQWPSPLCSYGSKSTHVTRTCLWERSLSLMREVQKEEALLPRLSLLPA